MRSRRGAVTYDGEARKIGAGSAGVSPLAGGRVGVACHRLVRHGANPCLCEREECVSRSRSIAADSVGASADGRLRPGWSAWRQAGGWSSQKSTAAR